MSSLDGVEFTFQPLSLPPDTETTILPISSDMLACGLEYTRFLPFGYKELDLNPPQSELDPPARVYWEIPRRFKSREQTKFLTAPSRGAPRFDWPLRANIFLGVLAIVLVYADSCDWKLKSDIGLETRVDPETGAVKYYAYTDVSRSSVLSLAQVLPLVQEDVPNAIIYSEESSAVQLSPNLELSVKKVNQWDVKYPNLRIRSLNITVAAGYEQSNDKLVLDDIPGFASTWHEDTGILTITAVPGHDFTDNTVYDYEDNAVELVDISEVLDSVDATATLRDFNRVVQLVKFQSSTVGSANRVFELSVNELLTADVIAKISWATVINTPDPPIVASSPGPFMYVEKAPLTAVDPAVEASR